MDAGYGNNVSFLLKLENRQLKYLGGLAKNRKITVNDKQNRQKTIRLDELAQALPQEAFTEIKLELDKPKTLWVATKEVEISGLTGKRNIAIVMNASTFSLATDIDYFITNISEEIVTPQWIVGTYGERNWVEVFYREAKGWSGLKEYQVRDKRSLLRHFILVFCAYTFILWHQLTEGLRRRWANKPLNTFTVDALAASRRVALEAFKTAMSFRFVDWLNLNRDVFAAYKASLGYIWA
ncbi:transposase [Nostoc minutum NIES-26]|uniref:Transposase n=1 Tax=Nostoc minutum NIES-26 TaxID=1844469 RepID=A0A367R1L5_9NOSO|nr:transposase [Nostoc minutum NIES-26]